jgi:magnesium transporter
MPKQKRKSQRPNLMTSPGTITYIGPKIELTTTIRNLVYNKYSIVDIPCLHVSDCRSTPIPPNSTQWIDVDGIHHVNVIKQIGQQFQLHPLLLEDIVNTEHKPKMDIYENEYLFVTMKMLHLHAESPFSVNVEHLSFVLGKSYLLSFQEEREQDSFAPVINRLKTTVGKTRSNGPDYLLFALMDMVIDQYFIVFERFSEQLELLEDRIIGDTTEVKLADLYTLKRELSLLRQVIWPLREIVRQLGRSENSFIKKSNIPYFRDLEDHVLQVLDSIDTSREILASLTDVYLSAQSNRMNSVMKTLTIFSAIFMPLTFIVGVYGMNFKYMPELNYPYGYFITWGMMILVTTGMIIYFKLKKWM